MPDSTHILAVTPLPHWRETLRSIHRWLGLIACLPLALQALSGIVLAVSENWLEPPHVERAAPTHAGAPSPAHSISEIVVAAASYAEAKQLSGRPQMVFIPAPNRPATVRMGGDLVQVDPRSLEVRQNTSFVNTVHAWHERLLTSWGHPIVGIFGACLAFFGLSGVILWWPAGRWRRALTPPAANHYQKGGYRAWYGWHLLIGGVSSAMALLVAVTGMSMAFGIPGNSVTNLAATSPDFPKLAAAGPLSLDAAVAAALNAVPGSRLRSVQLPRGEAGAARLDLVPAGRAAPGAFATTMTIDMGSGQVTSASHRALDGDGVAVQRFVHAIHSGNGYNIGWQIVVFAYGVALFVMSTTGFLMWLRRPRRKYTITDLPQSATSSSVRSPTDA